TIAVHLVRIDAILLGLPKTGPQIGGPEPGGVSQSVAKLRAAQERLIHSLFANHYRVRQSVRHIPRTDQSIERCDRAVGASGEILDEDSIAKDRRTADHDAWVIESGLIHTQVRQDDRESAHRAGVIDGGPIAEGGRFSGVADHLGSASAWTEVALDRRRGNFGIAD